MQAVCQKAGPPREVVSICSESLPTELEWGQVLVNICYAPIDAADIYTCTTGGTYDRSLVPAPFAAGHHGVGIVRKVTIQDELALLI